MINEEDCEKYRGHYVHVKLRENNREGWREVEGWFIQSNEQWKNQYFCRFEGEVKEEFAIATPKLNDIIVISEYDSLLGISLTYEEGKEYEHFYKSFLENPGMWDETDTENLSPWLVRRVGEKESNRPIVNYCGPDISYIPPPKNGYECGNSNVYYPEEDGYTREDALEARNRRSYVEHQDLTLLALSNLMDGQEGSLDKTVDHFLVKKLRKHLDNILVGSWIRILEHSEQEFVGKVGKVDYIRGKIYAIVLNNNESFITLTCKREQIVQIIP